jgi:hypothetical protein
MVEQHASEMQEGTDQAEAPPKETKVDSKGRDPA